jgi:predicted nucleotide-binding protein
MNLTYTAHGDINDAVRNFNDYFLEYFQTVLQEIVNANPELESTEVQKVTGNTVFIIHGHDDEIKAEVQLLLTRAGVNNIVLHEQPDKGRTIIDKLVEESNNSNYAIALLSPDDKALDGSARARQNVILEIGYFIGKLGKERVRILRKGEIEIPSDLSGVLYENYDPVGAWKIKLCKELIAAGIYVDIEAVTRQL